MAHGIAPHVTPPHETPQATYQLGRQTCKTTHTVTQRSQLATTHPSTRPPPPPQQSPATKPTQTHATLVLRLNDTPSLEDIPSFCHKQSKPENSWTPSGKRKMPSTGRAPNGTTTTQKQRRDSNPVPTTNLTSPPSVILPQI